MIYMAAHLKTQFWAAHNATPNYKNNKNTTNPHHLNHLLGMLQQLAQNILTLLQYLDKKALPYDLVEDWKCGGLPDYCEGNSVP